MTGHAHAGLHPGRCWRCFGTGHLLLATGWSGGRVSIQDGKEPHIPFGAAYSFWSCSGSDLDGIVSFQHRERHMVLELSCYKDGDLNRQHSLHLVTWALLRVSSEPRNRMRSHQAGTRCFSELS